MVNVGVRRRICSTCTRAMRPLANAAVTQGNSNPSRNASFVRRFAHPAVNRCSAAIVCPTTSST